MASKLAALAQVLFVLPNKRAVVPAFLTRPVHRSLKEGGDEEEEETEEEQSVRVFPAWVGANTKSSRRSRSTEEDEAHIAPINRPVARRALQQFQHDYYRSAVHNNSAEGRVVRSSNNSTPNEDGTRTLPDVDDDTAIVPPAVDDHPSVAVASARSLSSVSLAAQGTASATTAANSSSCSSSRSSGSASSILSVEDDDSFFPSSLDGDDYLYFAQ